MSAERAEGLFDERSISNQKGVDLRAELLEEVTRERATIEERELRAKAYELAAGACRPGQADQLVEELARGGELVRLEDGMWTTRHLRELEQATVQIAERRATENAALLNESSLKQARRETGKQIHGSLSAEQREALETITGPGGISLLVGHAGTGKGVVLSTAARAWQLEDYEVIGTAVAGATAQRLREEAQLDRSSTVDGLCNGVEKGHIHLGPRTVVVMDEAGMADTERLSRLAELTAQLPQQARPRRRRRAARPDRRRRALRAAARSSSQRRADRSPPCQSRLGAAGLGAGAEMGNQVRRSPDIRRTIASISMTPAPRPSRRWSPTGIRPAGPARRQGGDDHRRLQQRARPDQRDGSGAPCRRQASSARMRSSCPASPMACAPATR